MTRVAVAATSSIAADCARQVAAAGGNAVDAAIAAALVSMNTEPGVCSFAGGAYVTVWAPSRPPVTIDGIHAVPGLGLDPELLGRGAVSVDLDYGGGMTTIVGAGSVAVPGALAAFEKAWQRYGQVRWPALFEPSIDVVRSGFPLSASCHYYLGYCGELIYGRSDEGYRALHDENDKVLPAGSTIRVPNLADSLEMIAEQGARVFYEGELARAMSDHVRRGEGALTLEDLSQYEAIERPALTADVGDWRIATNPPPAVGGAILTAMLLACANIDGRSWDRHSLATLIRAHRACLDFRRDRLDLADDVGAESAQLIAAAGDGKLLGSWASSSTIHTSAVDDEGLGCAITASAGYGSGEMPVGTGLWLNNGLGEVELNRRGVDALAPGSRMPSNMAPCVARADKAVLAIGTPGADRITTAVHQVIVNALQMGMPLAEAVAHPRLHVDLRGDYDRIAAEPGLDLPDLDLPVEPFDSLNMYFGGVCAAKHERDLGFDVAADPRRESGTCIAGD